MATPINPIQSAAQGSAYIAHGAAEYMTESGEALAEFVGRGAAVLGLEGKFPEVKQVENLLLGKTPDGRQQLVERQRNKLLENGDRRVTKLGWEHVFQPPKSVSVMAIVDPRIAREVFETGKEIARYIDQKARLRDQSYGKKGKRGERQGAGTVSAVYLHQLARAAEEGGARDPHLHTHIFTANQVWDDRKRVWRTIAAHNLFTSQKKIDAFGMNVLAGRLRKLGHELVASKDGWEIKAVSQALRHEFSQRSRVKRSSGELSLRNAAALETKTAAQREQTLAERLRRAGWKMEPIKVTRVRQSTDSKGKLAFKKDGSPKTHISTETGWIAKLPGNRVVYDLTSENCTDLAKLNEAEKLLLTDLQREIWADTALEAKTLTPAEHAKLLNRAFQSGRISKDAASSVTPLERLNALGGPDVAALRAAYERALATSARRAEEAAQSETLTQVATAEQLGKVSDGNAAPSGTPAAPVKLQVGDKVRSLTKGGQGEVLEVRPDGTALVRFRNERKGTVVERQLRLNQLATIKPDGTSTTPVRLDGTVEDATAEAKEGAKLAPGMAVRTLDKGNVARVAACHDDGTFSLSFHGLVAGGRIPQRRFSPEDIEVLFEDGATSAIGADGTLAAPLEKNKGPRALERISRIIRGPDGDLTGAIDYVLGVAYDKASVAKLDVLVQAVAKRSLGCGSIEQIEEALRADPRVVVNGGFATTTEVLRKELVLRATIEEERHAVLPLIEQIDPQVLNERLYPPQEVLQLEARRDILVELKSPTKEELREQEEVEARLKEHGYLGRDQRAAILGFLKSDCRGYAWNGLPGTGKTTSLREIKGILKRTRESLHTLLEDSGYKVVTVAPTSAASRVRLRESGFSDANTLTALLNAPDKFKVDAKTVLILDEAGLGSVEQIAEFKKLSRERGAPNLLLGDINQLTPVGQGDGMRFAIELGAPCSVLGDIRRQDKNRGYKEAVRLAFSGKPQEAFDVLVRMGAVHVEADQQKRYDLLANDLVAHRRNETRAISVSATHREGDASTDVIRAKMLKEGLLDDSKKIILNELRSENFEAPLKADWRSYKPGQVVVFAKGGGRWTSGSKWEVLQAGEAGVLVRELPRSGKKAKPTPTMLPISSPKYLESFGVFRRRRIDLVIGDDVRFSGRIAAEQVPSGGAFLDNGNLGRIAAIDTKKRIITLENGAKIRLGEDEQITHGYVNTTYVAQGDDKKAVHSPTDAKTIQAMGSMQDFGVMISRGQEDIKIYTDDPGAIRENIVRNSHRMLAHEALGLLNPAVSMRQVLDQELRQRLARVLPAEELQQIERHIGEVRMPQVATQVTPPAAQQVVPAQERPRAMAAGF
ncbi:hypothetical protein DB347_17925 [Opitutaceae bacterium EW11]|nr:hypothetical protein DB347_17925 [Opitutaceae bacterium EW11]